MEKKFTFAFACWFSFVQQHQSWSIHTSRKKLHDAVSGGDRSSSHAPLTIHLFPNSHKTGSSKTYTPRTEAKHKERGREKRMKRATGRDERERERGRLKSAGALVPHFARSEARPVAATNILQLRNGVLRTRKPHRVCGNVTVVAGMAMRNRLGNQKRAKLVTVSPPLLYKMFTVFYFSPFLYWFGFLWIFFFTFCNI